VHVPLVTAIKGLIGHTLGASGLIETALAAHMFARQIVPPVTNLQTPEYPALDLVVGAPRTPSRPIRHILKLASGFGGLNAAVILAAPPHPGAPNA
jgi:3-oxoacyl-[acyl-carrier-protein] synthase II